MSALPSAATLSELSSGIDSDSGLNSLTHSPTSSDADTTDFDSGGRSEHMKAERGESWTLSSFAL